MNRDAIMRRLMLGPDAKSNRGLFARGKTVYRGVSNSPNTGKMSPNSKYRDALERRLRGYG